MPKGIKKQNLEKGMYQKSQNQGRSFTEVLEMSDPSQEYAGTSFAKLDAFERQLAAFDLRTSGRKVSELSEFFKTSQSAVLFPEFVSRNIELGMNRGKMEATVNDVIATTTNIDQADYRTISVDESNMKADYRRVAEGAEFPKIKILMKEKQITLQKIGLKIESSYEAVRRTKLNVLAIAFQAIGRNLATKIVTEAVNVLINGDGNSNPAALISSATPGTLAYNDLVDLDMAFVNFESDTLIGNKATITKILKMAEFKDGLIGDEYKKTGRFITPLGNTLLVNNSIAGNLLLGFSKSAGVEQVIETGSSLVEEDKLIDRQMNESVVSRVTGFAKLWPTAAVGLTF